MQNLLKRLSMWGGIALLVVGIVAVLPVTRVAVAQDDDGTAVPFPTSVNAQTVTATVAPNVTLEATITTASLTLDEAVATVAAIQAEVERLTAENVALKESLSTSQSDNGATLYALVIVVIGFVLAGAIFFGLRRSGS